MFEKAPVRVERFHSRDQCLCKFIGTEEGFNIRKMFDSHRIDPGHRDVDVLLFWDTKKTDVTSCENALYATSTFPIMHLICLSPPPPPLPPRKEICTTFAFHFSWILQPSQEKLKTLLMQHLGGGGDGWGQIRCIMGNV